MLNTIVSTRILLIGFLATTLLWSCKKEDMATPDPANPNTAVMLKDVVYGSGSRQVADVYLPKGRSGSTATLVLLHGGSWVAGDKADLNQLIPALQAAMPEVALLNINYSLADGQAANRFPAQLNDIAAALNFLSTKASGWSISGNRYSLVGISSGGHLALNYAFTRNNPAIKMIGSIVGPTDLTNTFYTTTPAIQQVLTSLLGKSYTEDPALHRNASPTFQVKPGLMPVFLCYGGQDPLVPLPTAEGLQQKLLSANVTAELNVFPTEQHEFSNAATGIALSRLVLFYRAHVK